MSHYDLSQPKTDWHVAARNSYAGLPEARHASPPVAPRKGTSLWRGITKLFAGYQSHQPRPPHSASRPGGHDGSRW